MECHLNDLRQKHPGKWRAAPVHPLLGADVCLSFKVEMDYRVYSFARTVQILSWVWLVTRSWPQPGHTLQIRAQIEKPLEPDLAAVVAAWPSLSAPLKAAIVAIANTATNKGGQ